MVRLRLGQLFAGRKPEAVIHGPAFNPKIIGQVPAPGGGIRYVGGIQLTAQRPYCFQVQPFAVKDPQQAQQNQGDLFIRAVHDQAAVIVKGLLRVLVIGIGHQLQAGFVDIQISAGVKRRRFRAHNGQRHQRRQAELLNTTAVLQLQMIHQLSVQMAGPHLGQQQVFYRPQQLQLRAVNIPQADKICRGKIQLAKCGGLAGVTVDIRFRAGKVCQGTGVIDHQLYRLIR